MRLLQIYGSLCEVPTSCVLKLTHMSPCQEHKRLSQIDMAVNLANDENVESLQFVSQTKNAFERVAIIPYPPILE